MDELKLPLLPEIINENTVIISKQELKTVIDFINGLREALVSQQDCLYKLIDYVKNHDDAIKNIAKIMEDSYDA